MYRRASWQSGKPSRRGIAFLAMLAIGMALACSAGAANPSEPAAVAALRADQTHTAAQLETQAARLRTGTQDPKFRAWATLAEAEFANDQEHAEHGEAVALEPSPSVGEQGSAGTDVGQRPVELRLLLGGEV